LRVRFSERFKSLWNASRPLLLKFENMKYYSGRTNLAATIFVPVKCGNNCKFCNTNILYKDFEYNEEYLLNMLYAIDMCNNNDKINEFVITGGEPIMNLDILKIIIDRTEKPVYINTSLPIVENINDVIDYINTEDKIKGVSSSGELFAFITVAP
jgi:organic radical activating enzyme